MSDQEKWKPETPFVDRLRGGDNDAWTLFYQKYERRVRKYLTDRIRRSGWSSRADSGDVWGALVASLLRRLESEKGQIAIEKMTAFLMGMAKNKWRAANAREYASKRNPKREIADASAVNRVVQPGETPSQVAIARETLTRTRENHIRSMQPQDELDRAILERTFEGYSVKEIAEELTQSRRTVQLRLQKMKGRKFVGRLDDMESQILELNLQGYSPEEIAKKIGRVPRSVELRFEKMDYIFAIGVEKQ